MCNMIKEYYPAIYDDPKKQYVNFVRDKTVVLSIIPSQSYLNVTLRLEPEKLTPNDRLEDIRNKGHWGVGDSRMKVSSEEDVWLVLDYIDQILGSIK